LLVLFPSIQFDFLKGHNGFQAGMCHVLVGTTGTGKSTLARSILAQQAKETNVFYYSSEETKNEFI
jgi:KaiC/GvpD/RAD55 family RecA-like ATPase